MKIRDRIVDLRRVKASELIPSPQNWRVHPEAQQNAMKGILAEVGIADALLVRETTAGLQLIDGHLRADTAPDAEWPVLVLDVNDDEAAKLLATVDPIAGMAEVDEEKLAALLAEIEVESEALQSMLDDLGEEPEPVEIIEDEVPELPADPVTKPGDLWLLGEHRLLCGDSTKEEDLTRLMDGEAIGCVHADPPYGMCLDTDFDKMFSNDAGHRKTGARFDAVIGDDKPFDPTPFLPLAAESFWWGADYYRDRLPAGGSWFVWDKRGNESGMNLDAVVGSCFELCWSQTKHKRELLRFTWSGHHGLQREDTKSRVHPNQKPTAVVAALIRKTSDTIYAPFLGSGTSLIAAEQLGRKCYGMEISPAYCDVIWQRWANLTGKTPERVEAVTA